eukprot:COSAG03_NODE_10053_length_675_cov_2.841085_1_plen_141_part_10
MPNASYAKQVGLQRTPTQLLRKIRAGYAGGITWTDMQIGKVLDALDATGKAKDTLVMYWADHGWALGEQAMFCQCSVAVSLVIGWVRKVAQRAGRLTLCWFLGPAGKMANFELQTRVPMMIRAPWLTMGGRSTTAMTELVD